MKKTTSSDAMFLPFILFLYLFYIRLPTEKANVMTSGYCRACGSFKRLEDNASNISVQKMSNGVVAFFAKNASQSIF